MTISDRIVAALAGLGQAAADYNISELIDGSAIVRLQNTHEVAATQKALEQAGLMVEQQDPASLRIWSAEGTGVEPLGAPLPDEGDSLADGVSPDAGQPGQTTVTQLHPNDRPHWRAKPWHPSWRVGAS